MMNPQIRKRFNSFFVFAFICLNAFAQPGAPLKQFSKLPEVISRLEDSLKKQFEKQKLVYPPQAMYLRSFKFDRQLEVWVKSSSKEPYKLFKTYKVCQQSGSTGPKRAEGDYQVPEGFYYINEFNPNSMYHLALGLNYPNASDRILADQHRPGSAIYIHGNCVSTGCIPITDEPIEELYFLANSVRNQGEEFIPVHVFPIKYNVAKSKAYLEVAMKDNEPLKLFNKNIKEVFDYFELKKELPIIMVNKKGEYVLN
jgi:murein L,D-transpeptidase YafK